MITIRGHEEDSIKGILVDIIKREWKYARDQRGVLRPSNLVRGSLDEFLAHVGNEAWLEATHGISQEAIHGDGNLRPQSDTDGHSPGGVRPVN